MQVSVEQMGKLERKLTVRIPTGQLESQVKSRIQEMGRNVRLKGFRPGKVPVKVIEQRFGSQVRGEALSELIRASCQEALAQQKLRPAMAPSISTSGEPSDGEIEYTATFEVLPEFDPIDVGALTIIKPVANVADVDVDEMIETLRQQRRNFNPVERAASAGDMVLFEYSAQVADYRHPAEGMDRVGTIVGSGAMTKELEDQLVGRKSSEKIEVDVAFPSSFRITDLAGKLARVDIKIVRVQEAKLPEIDTTFIASFGIKDGSMEQFRADVRANLERELKTVLAGRLKMEVVQKLVDSYASLDVPQGMVDAEAHALARQAETQRQQGQSGTVDAFKEVARRRVAAAVLVGELARQNEIRLDAKRVAETLATIASTYEEPERVVELYQRDPQLMSGLQNRVLEDQVAEWVAAHAQLEERILGFKEVMRPGAA